MGLLQIIDKSFQPIQHPFGIKISDSKILAASFARKFYDAAKLDPGSDFVFYSILRHLDPWLPSRPIDPNLDDIFVSPAHKGA